MEYKTFPWWRSLYVRSSLGEKSGRRGPFETILRPRLNEERSKRAIEDEKDLYGYCEGSKEAIVKVAQGGVLAPLT